MSDQNETPATLVYPQAILFPLLSFPAWILCIVPMYWHFSKQNIAAGSLILWIVANNFFNSINPLIWPRDNLDDWWDGRIWCDINVRIQVGATVGIAASTVMVMRKLARVMDTRNITLSNPNSKTKEKVLEVLWCWLYPLLMIVLYYVVQPARYLLFGVVGCISALHESWPSVVLNCMWAPVTMLVAVFYSSILIFRLCCYHREFDRLIANSNTNKSRFVRLFVISAAIILVYFPVSCWMLASRLHSINEPYVWKQVHGPDFNKIFKYQYSASGQLSIEKWGQVVTGYVIFLVFGTSSDAHKLHKGFLLKLGLEKFFPSLSDPHENESSILRRLVSVSLNLSRTMFQTKDSLASTSSGGNTLPCSVKSESPIVMHQASTIDTSPVLQQHGIQHDSSSMAPFFFRPNSRRAAFRGPLLPLFARRAPAESAVRNQSIAQSVPLGTHSHVRVSEQTYSEQANQSRGIHVVRGIHQASSSSEPANSS